MLHEHSCAHIFADDITDFLPVIGTDNGGTEHGTERGSYVGTDLCSVQRQHREW